MPILVKLRTIMHARMQYINFHLKVHCTVSLACMQIAYLHAIAIIVMDQIDHDETEYVFNNIIRFQVKLLIATPSVDKITTKFMVIRPHAV